MRNGKIIFDSKHHFSDPITFLRIQQTDCPDRLQYSIKAVSVSGKAVSVQDSGTSKSS